MAQVLVKFRQTHCFTYENEKKVQVQDVLDRLNMLYGIPFNYMYLRVHGTTIMHELSALVPTSPHVIHVGLRGALRGGKGGFGAMLRAQGKGPGSKVTRDFGACRDLHGRRLRHVNQEIALQKWNDEKDLREQRRKAGITDKELDSEKTASGIEGWHLSVPNWAEGVRKTKHDRRKTEICKAWLETRQHKTPPPNAPLWWGCYRGQNCEYAHGEGELIGSGLTEYKTQQKLKKEEEIHRQRDAYAAFDSDLGDSVSNAVREGLKKAFSNKKRKADQEKEDQVRVLPVNEHSSRVKIAQSVANMDITPLFGSVSIRHAEGEIVGVTDFGTASIYGCYLRKGKWYYEVQLITEGIIQIGWADEAFEGNSNTGDGVGDHIHSWAFDGARLQKWNADPESYGLAWKAGDTIGCLLDLDQQSIEFKLNGQSMGIAFTDLQLQGGLFPCFSLEKDEIIRVNIGQRPFIDQEPLGYLPIDKALSSGTLPPPVVEEAKKATKVNTPKKDTSKKDTSKKDKVTLKPKKKLKTAPNVTPEALELENISSIAELEALGLDRLKAALLAAGLKCGGTLQQRAQRLFSIKGKSREEIDPKLLTKPMN